MTKNKIFTLSILAVMLFSFAVALNAVCTHPTKSYINVYDSVEHVVKCTSCNEFLDRENHTFSYDINATSHTPRCSKCGYLKSSESHSFYYTSDYNTHTKKCSVCGYVGSVNPHNWPTN